MRFDLEAHLKHHAFVFKKHSEVLPNSIHFNFSFLDLQFLDKNVEDTMSKLLAALLLPASYNVANGKRKDKHGNTVQKFTTRKIKLQKDVQALAIHLKGPEGEDTMPHIHFIADGSARFGNSYSLLKKHISAISKQFGLLPNFDEIVEHNPLSVKSLSHAVNQITWSWKKSTNAQLKSEISSRGLNKSISLLKSYCLKTKNLTYYVKSMEGLKTRLNRMHLDIAYKGHQLRNTYPIPLTQEDMDVIKLLQDKKFTQKAIKPYFKNPVLRDFIRHSSGTTKPYIYDALKKQTTLLNHVSKNKQAVDSYKKIMDKETPLRKSQLTPRDNTVLSRKNELRRVIIETSQSAANEKTFRFLMQQAGYNDFGLKKKQGKVIGCIYKELEINRTVNFTDLGVHWGNLKKLFMHNSRKLENAEILPSPTLVKKEPTPHETLKLRKRTKLPNTVAINYKHTELALKKERAKKTSQERRSYEKIIPSIKAEIIKFENFVTQLKRRISEFKNNIYAVGIKIKEFAGYSEKHAHLKKQYSREETAEIAESRDIEKLERKISITEGEQSDIALRFREAREMEYKIDGASNELEITIRDAKEEQSNIENGDYEFILIQRVTNEIREEERNHKELRDKISQLEIKPSEPHTNKSRPSARRGPRM